MAICPICRASTTYRVVVDKRTTPNHKIRTTYNYQCSNNHTFQKVYFTKESTKAAPLDIIFEPPISPKVEVSFPKCPECPKQKLPGLGLSKPQGVLLPVFSEGELLWRCTVCDNKVRAKVVIK